MSRRTCLLLALALLCALLFHHEASRNLPVRADEVPGHYVFKTARPDGASTDCLTLTPDGRFAGPGLHAVDDAEPTSGKWQLLRRGHRTFLTMGALELSISRHLRGRPTLTLGPEPGPNDCTRE